MQFHTVYLLSKSTYTLYTKCRNNQCQITQSFSNIIFRNMQNYLEFQRI